MFSAFAHLYYPLAGVLWKWLCHRLKWNQTTSLFLLPLTFALCERLYPFIFFWHLGYPWLWAGFPGFHLAQWIGFFGINLINLFINAFLCVAWINWEKNGYPWSFSKKKKSCASFGKPLAFAILIILVTNILGFVISRQLKPADQSLRVLMVQGNIGNMEKVRAQKGPFYRRSIVNTYVDLTRRGLEQSDNVDLVIWPETAFPETLIDGYMGYYRQTLAKFSEEFQVPILTGAFQKKKNKDFNALVLMDGTKILDSYQKIFLLAFGEYIPFVQYLPFLKKILPMVSDFGRGEGPSVLKHPKALIGSQICYEGLFDELSADLQKKKAQIFVNVTNDSWFGYPFEPYQHMYMTLARAIENRRPMIRVTNTGLSTVIHSDGRILKHSPHNQEWFETFDIPYHSTPPSTFYANLAKNWPWILLLLIGAMILGGRIAGIGKH